MTRPARQVFWLLLLLLTLAGTASVSAQEVRRGLPLHQAKTVEPVELTGPATKMPAPPTEAVRRFWASKALQSLNPKDATTLAPALRELTSLLQQEPNNSDAYLLRALVSCKARADTKSILNDITMSLSTRASSKSSAYDTLKDHYALKAKVEFDGGRYQDALNDLETAIKQNYGDAAVVFNDGNVKPTTITEPCVWTHPDLQSLTERFPTDYRPHLYIGLYLNFFNRFSADANAETNFQPVLKEFERAATLNPASPLPHYFIGDVYTSGGLGGLLSTANAKCIDDIVPRTPACLALDGVRSLTRAIALDPQFRPAYAMRADAFYRLKQYRQAIRDYDKVLELNPNGDTARPIYNDRGLAKMALGQNQAAVEDFDTSIAKACEDWICGTYENRAEAYLKLHDYTRAIADISLSIKKFLSSAVYLMNIDQFRRIYPEYDGVADDALCEQMRALFSPQMSYVDFAKRFLIEANHLSSSVLPELYLKRGDAYAKLNEVKKANVEYDRVSQAFPEWAKIWFSERNGTRVRNP